MTTACSPLEGVEPSLFFDNPDISDYQKEEMREQLWLCGDIRFCFRDGPQRDFYDRFVALEAEGFKDVPNFCYDVHRGMGKTYSAFALACRCALSKPAATIYLFAPVGKQASRALKQQMAPIFASMPAYLRPKRHEKEHYSFFNPDWGVEDSEYTRSDLYLIGTESDFGDSARGGGADLVIFDEVRDMKAVDYLYDDVVFPMLERKPCSASIMLSSQPKTRNHPFVSRFLPDAEIDGTWFYCNVEMNPQYDEARIAVILKKLERSGGRDSSTWRREWMCERIAIEDDLIVPEFLEYEEKVEPGEAPKSRLVFKADEHERPSHYHGFIIVDFGGSADYHSVLAGYVNYQYRRVVFLDELWLRRVNTEVLANQIKDLKFRTFDHPDVEGNCVDVFMVGEGKTPTILQDMAELHGLPMLAAKPMERESAQGFARPFLKDCDISEKCVHLVHQMRNGQRDPKTFKFLRSAEMGHCDAVASWVITMRYVMEVLIDKNPFPPEPLPSLDTHYVDPALLGKRRNTKYRKARR